MIKALLPGAMGLTMAAVAATLLILPALGFAEPSASMTWSTVVGILAGWVLRSIQAL